LTHTVDFSGKNENNGSITTLQFMRRIKAADGFRQASVSQSLIAISTQSQWIPHVITSPFCVALQYNLVSG